MVGGMMAASERVNTTHAARLGAKRVLQKLPASPPPVSPVRQRVIEIESRIGSVDADATLSPIHQTQPQHVESTHHRLASGEDSKDDGDGKKGDKGETSEFEAKIGCADADATLSPIHQEMQRRNVEQSAHRGQAGDEADKGNKGTEAGKAAGGSCCGAFGVVLGEEAAGESCCGALSPGRADG
jgi:hypothetical protein